MPSIRVRPEAIEKLKAHVAPHLDALETSGAPEEKVGDIKDAIIEMLQQALELEHATIPTYLYALYSLNTTATDPTKPSQNGAIADIVQSIVVEEMLHMTLDCNILNALGGSPKINTPSFIPTYPGPLPGGVHEGLIVPLAPFSIGLIGSVFMVIEEPESAITTSLRALMDKIIRGQDVTIGEFYQAIGKLISTLNDTAFTGDSSRQVPPEIFPDTVVVSGVDTALSAIGIVVEQGEGTSTSPDDNDDELAHYYRFGEIYHGKMYIKVGEKWDYVGDPVLFDASGVYNVPTNPKAAQYSGAAEIANNNFNYTYTGLLTALHNAFNGNPEGLNSAIGLMESLKEQAKSMMSGRSTGGANVGPSFEYQPTNPS